MKLFVSWSGERSKALATGLRDWFPLVLHYVEPWLSEADIEAGTRWADAVAKQLEACNFGIICITRENLASPWILFESGALAKSLEGSRVIPLLLDLDFRDISGPLAQFQAKKVEKNGLMEIVESINKTATHPVPEDRYRQLFEALWPDLEKKVSAIPKAPTVAKQTRTQADVLEELVSAVRAVEARVRDGVEEPRSMRKRGRLHPMMVMEFSRMLSEKPGDPIVILMYASLLRDDAPWLYELGVEAYRQASSGRVGAAKSAMQKFARALELSVRGPFPPDELGVDSRLHHRILKDIDQALEFEMEQLGSSKTRRSKAADESDA